MALQYSTVLVLYYCTVLYSTVLSTVQYSILYTYNTVLYCKQYCTVYSMYCTVQYRRADAYSTVL